MTADAQTDLFTFGLANKKPLKEQVTPHKLALLVLINEYSVIKKAENLAPNVFALDEREPVMTFTETEKRNFMITILQLLQSQDLKLKELSVKIQDNLNIQLYETFCDRLREFFEEGIRVIQDFFQNLSFLLIQEGLIELCISKFSVLGVFLRRMILAFEKLTFSQVIKLHAKFVEYYNDGQNEQVPEESNIFGGSLTDTALSLSEVRFNKSGLGHSMDALRHTDWKSSQVPSGFFSQKQAEYFIAQQGMLLQHNENEALSPQVLQERIMDILKARPDIAEAHFLSYLNSLRVKEYCTAVHNLYHYFDRNMSLMDSNSTNKGREEDVCRRYAALNLALLHYRFGHKKESKAALHEAIRLAQGTNDHVCLQHALSWLYRLEEQGSAKTANLMERAVTKSSELSLPNLTSLGVQSLAKHNAFAGAKPSSVFEYIMKSDILNCQHSQSGFMCMSYTQKAALWKMYGKRECHAMTSQLVLNLDTSESCVYHNGEPVCIALCNMAKLHADNGQYTLAFDIINNTKLRFPPHTQHAYLWMSCEQEILFDRTLLNRKWSITEQAVLNLKALNEPEAELRNAILCKEKGDVTSALSQLNKLLEKLNKDDTEVSPDFKCRTLFSVRKHNSSHKLLTRVYHKVQAALSAADGSHCCSTLSLCTVTNATA
ncbi:hypothetical protein ACJMK2_040023 [Sinanodonta woodiana]|uniref:Anaphase-promoting complex subunit 5 n=1 Tax=Sinanodonta woodiana TaxID=1069815 RepID=A0ABD3WDX3_SINWO